MSNIIFNHLHSIMRHFIKSKIVFGLFLIIGFPSVKAQQLYYPDAIWQSKKPAEVKMNAQMVDSAVNFAIKNEIKLETDLRIALIKSWNREPNYKLLGPVKDRGKAAGVILKNGYIVAQWGDVNRVDMTFSVTKSFLSTVAGLALDDHLIKNVDDKVNKYVWDDKFESAHNAKITWRHLLTQSSDWSGSLFDCEDWADRPAKEGGIEDWKRRELHEPGTFFKYNDARVNLLAYSLLQVYRKPLPQILKEKIMDPIGASTTWRWYGYDNAFVNMDGVMTQSVSGGGHHGGGLFISTLDHARFGLLYDRNGKWNNQQLISENWVKSINQPSAANKSYGFMWWTNQENQLGSLSKEIYYAAGYGGNYIIIDKEHDLVMVTRWLDTTKLNEFIALVEGALEKGK
jgi:CubicO group peptidase (beta-lactamase class C family)